MANPSKVWETVTNKWLGEECRRLSLAIGQTVVDKEEVRGRTYILVGPPATGKSTLLRLIQMIFAHDTTVQVIHDLDGKKVADYKKENGTVFCASNVEPPEDLPDVYVIRTKKKSLPMSLDEYNKVVKIMERNIDDLRRYCCYRYVLTDTAYRKLRGEKELV